MFLIISFCQLKFGNIIQEKDVVVKILAIAEKIIKKKTGGRHGYWFYDFHFKNYSKVFRFDEFDYKYASSIPDFENYKTGDTVVIEILKEDVKKLNTKNFFSKHNRIIGIKVDNKSIINYTTRYKQIEQSNKKWIYVLSLALLIDIFLIAISLRFTKIKSSS